MGARPARYKYTKARVKLCVIGKNQKKPKPFQNMEWFTKLQVKIMKPPLIKKPKPTLTSQLGRAEFDYLQAQP